jgi:hypothetical protein
MPTHRIPFSTVPLGWSARSPLRAVLCYSVRGGAPATFNPTPRRCRFVSRTSACSSITSSPVGKLACPACPQASAPRSGAALALGAAEGEAARLWNERGARIGRSNRPAPPCVGADRTPGSEVESLRERGVGRELLADARCAGKLGRWGFGVRWVRRLGERFRLPFRCARCRAVNGPTRSCRASSSRDDRSSD